MLKSHLLREIMWYDKAHELQHVSVTRKFIRFSVKHNNFGLILIEKRSQVRLSPSPLLEPGPRARVQEAVSVSVSMVVVSNWDRDRYELICWFKKRSHLRTVSNRDQNTETTSRWFWDGWDHLTLTQWRYNPAHKCHFCLVYTHL